MGIKGLLKVLRPIAKNVNISEFSGNSVAVDGSCWLHQAMISCASELCQNKETIRYRTWFLKRAELLLRANLRPIFVFDGDLLPAKLDTYESRKRDRERNKLLGQQELKKGNSELAQKYFKKAVEITPEMILEVVTKLREKNLDFIVAPYEADAQIAHLSLTNQVDLVITEDSDLLVYGCPKVLFKMDPLGNGNLIELANLNSLKKLNFSGFTHAMFRHMCILSGCDFVKSLPGLGVIKAHSYIKRFETIQGVLYFLRKHSIIIPEEYERIALEAEQVFLYQRVYSREQRKLITLNELPPNLSKTIGDHIGFNLSPEISFKISQCLINPKTKKQFRKNLEESEPQGEYSLSDNNHKSSTSTINLQKVSPLVNSKKRLSLRLTRTQGYWEEEYDGFNDDFKHENKKPKKV